MMVVEDNLNTSSTITVKWHLVDEAITMHVLVHVSVQKSHGCGIPFSSVVIFLSYSSHWEVLTRINQSVTLGTNPMPPTSKNEAGLVKVPVQCVQAPIFFNKMAIRASSQLGQCHRLINQEELLRILSWREVTEP